MIHRCASLVLLGISLSSGLTAGTIEFEDISASAGLDFIHDNGRQGDWQYPEILGGGCGLVDLDQDGWLDLVLIQSGPLPRRARDRDPPERESAGGSRLYLNRGLSGPDHESKVSNLRFEDITEASGLRAFGYGMGLASGDLSGNGFPDLYITNYGPNQLWQNNGDGTFSDITTTSSTGDPGFSASASVADLNGDGRLDLFVVNYVQHDPENNPTCMASTTRRDYCGPAVFPAAHDRLFINQDGKRFVDRSDQALTDKLPLRGLGVVVADLDQDGLPDIFVANDGDANQFWKNLGNGRFSEQALVSGTAVNRHGQMEAGMGIGLADYNDDDRWDLFLSHLDGESNTLYRNLGEGLFVDDTAAAGLLLPSLPFTGFGTAFADFDLDGNLDLFVANGAVRVEEVQRASGIDYPLKQADLVFRNLNGRRFIDVTPDAGPPLKHQSVGRGAAFGDLDNDGRTDILLCDNHGPARLLINRTGAGHDWLGLRLLTGEPARDALVAKVGLIRQGKPFRWRRAASDGSYLVANDPRVLFGLGSADSPPQSVEVQWPDGATERFLDLMANRYHSLKQGQGETSLSDSQ